MEALRCELCGEAFSNVELYHEHLNHEVHLRNARYKQTYRCEICDGGYSGEVTFLAHIGGRPHEKQMKTMSQLANREKLAMIRGEADSDLACGTSSSKVLTTKDGPYHVCKDCKALCNTEEQLQMHQQGQKCRKKRVQKMDENERSMSLPRDKTGHELLHISSSGMVNPSEFSLDQNQSDPETVLEWKQRNDKKSAEMQSISPIVSTTCFVCETVLPGGENSRMVHENGKNHQRNLKALDSMIALQRLRDESTSSIENSDVHEFSRIERKNSNDSNMSDTNTVSSYATAFSDITSLGLAATRSSGQQNRRTDDIFEHYTKGKGCCLIISQESFSEEDGGNRNGSKQDVNILKETFEYLNFKVIIEVDLTLEDMRARLQEFAYTLYTNESDISLMCVCVLSHGDENCIKTIDGQGIRLDEVKHFFDSRNCPSMNGKPKLFVRNACRGRNVLRNLEVLLINHYFWILLVLFIVQFHSTKILKIKNIF